LSAEDWGNKFFSERGSGEPEGCGCVSVTLAQQRVEGAGMFVHPRVTDSIGWVWQFPPLQNCCAYKQNEPPQFQADISRRKKQGHMRRPKLEQCKGVPPRRMRVVLLQCCWEE
jgi:hypothetical protein